MVLNRFFSGTAPVRRDEEDSGLVRVDEVIVERDAGVAGILRVPAGLVTEDRLLGTAGFLAGVAAVVVLEGNVLSATVEGAKDILLGLAEIPSFFLSSVASAELTDVRFR